MMGWTERCHHLSLLATRERCATPVSVLRRRYRKSSHTYIYTHLPFRFLKTSFIFGIIINERLVRHAFFFFLICSEG